MAIEVKELIIKLTVSSNAPQPGKVSTAFSHSFKNELIKECVEKALAKIESKMER